MKTRIVKLDCYNSVKFGNGDVSESLYISENENILCVMFEVELSG